MAALAEPRGEHRERSFRGSMAALDLDTGAVLWKKYMVPEGYPGGAVWGSAPAVDPRRGQVYIATGYN